MVAAIMGFAELSDLIEHDGGEGPLLCRKPHGEATRITRRWML